MKIKGVVITVVLIAAIIAVAVLGYNYLTKEYAPVQESQQSEQVKALDFTVTDEQGNTVSLSDFAGKPIVVNFWATWCDPCKMEMPYFQKAYERYGDNVTFLMVNVDGGAAPTASVTGFLADGGYTFPVYYDGNYSASLAYSVDAIPETVFITADGYISHTKIGAISENQLNSEIERILGEAQQ